MGCPVDGVDGDRGLQYEFNPSSRHLDGSRGINLPLQALAIGIGCRLGLHVKPESKGMYITEYSLVTLSVRCVSFQPLLKNVAHPA
jgi:hypothetical protein